VATLAQPMKADGLGPSKEARGEGRTKSSLVRSPDEADASTGCRWRQSQRCSRGPRSRSGIECSFERGLVSFQYLQSAAPIAAAGNFEDHDMRADREFQRCGGITEEFLVHEDFGAVGIGSDEDGSGAFRWWSLARLASSREMVRSLRTSEPGGGDISGTPAESRSAGTEGRKSLWRIRWCGRGGNRRTGLQGS